MEVGGVGVIYPKSLNVNVHETKHKYRKKLKYENGVNTDKLWRNSEHALKQHTNVGRMLFENYVLRSTNYVRLMPWLHVK